MTIVAATIEEAEVVRKILTHLKLPVEAPQPAPARQLAWLVEFAAGTE